MSASDEDNISLRSIIRSSVLNVYPSDIAEITNTRSKGIRYHGRDKWWEELNDSKAKVATRLIGNSGTSVRDIHTSSLLTPVRAILSVVQHSVFSTSGNIDVMSGVAHMVMSYLMTKRRINMVRLMLDFIIAAVEVEKKKHASLPYGMFLTRVFIKARFLLEGERADSKRPITTMKTF